ncbi:hypothetical protein [Halospeciosus flavus]|uniref:Uncharacterized protein n=1 Tax=Halospeciosus flavus TaxID=3032283 RepID=A0ABD5Z0S9_9EURY|nr:hypothetical protein [Halospeciosus flavus]
MGAGPGRSRTNRRRDEGGGDTTSRLRRPVDRLWRWLSLTGDRRVVALLVLLSGFVAIALADTVIAVSVTETLADEQTTVPLVSTLLSGTFFLFSIVVSVNSLFVSQQQNPVAQQFGRIQGIVEYRRQLEGVVDVDHVPARPEPLVRLLSGDILERAQYLQDQLSTFDVEVRENVEGYVASLAEETGEMNQELRDAESTFDVTLAMMDYNHDRQINDLRRLRAEYSEHLDERTEETIDELLRLLQYFATAREYFKTIATRREFALLSRDLVLTATVSAAIVSAFMHFLDELPDSNLLVAGAEAVAFAPFVLVGAYVLRVAVVSYRTQAAGQFVVDERGGDIRGIRVDGRED